MPHLFQIKTQNRTFWLLKMVTVKEAYFQKFLAYPTMINNI